MFQIHHCLDLIRHAEAFLVIENRHVDAQGRGVIICSERGSETVTSWFFSRASQVNSVGFSAFEKERFIFTKNKIQVT